MPYMCHTLDSGVCFGSLEAHGQQSLHQVSSGWGWFLCGEIYQINWTKTAPHPHAMWSINESPNKSTQDKPETDGTLVKVTTATFH